MMLNDKRRPTKEEIHEWADHVFEKFDPEKLSIILLAGNVDLKLHAGGGFSEVAVASLNFIAGSTTELVGLLGSLGHDGKGTPKERKMMRDILHVATMAVQDKTEGWRQRMKRYILPISLGVNIGWVLGLVVRGLLK